MTHPFHLSSFAILVGALVQPTSAASAQATGSIVGVVRDSGGARLERTRIIVMESPGQRPPMMTDTAGAYRIDAVTPGAIRVFAMRVGYAPETLRVTVTAGRTSRADFSLEAVHVLTTIPVVADPTRGKMGPFNRRRARGVGAFVTRAEIEKRQPGSISEMLRYLPGVAVTQKMAGEPQPVHMSRSVNSSLQSTCVVQLYVDGQPYPNGNLDDFAPLSVEGVEVYRSASEIPAEFRTRDATCGVISLWTRDPEAARRRP